MLNSIFAEGETSFNPQPTARNLNKPARMLRLGTSRLGVCLCIHIFRRVGEADFAAQTSTEQGESPDTLSILARDPLPLRLCTFASLRSFLPTALRAVFPLAPPRPLSPSQSPGGEGEPSGLGRGATVLWLIDHGVSGCLVLARRAAHGLPVCVSHRIWEITPTPPKPGGRHMGDLVIPEAEHVFAQCDRY